MKNKLLIVTFISAAAFAVGCDKEPTASQQLDKMQADTKQAAQDMKDYTYAQKADFVKSMQDQIAVLDQNLDKLSDKIETSSDSMRAEAKPKLQALRDQSAKLKQQLADVQNSTESTWDSVKSGTKQAYDSLQTSFMNARQWVSDKIAP
jgi:ElaB/YqjD/DUF883 family membrane-anchored ribosome-binding protein